MKDRPNNKAVILGCNFFIGLSTIRCLGMEGVHTVAVDYKGASSYGAASKYCSERLEAPHYREEPRAFIDFLIDYARKQSAKPVLIPCHDNYVEIVDAHLLELKEHYLIPQTEQGLLTKLMNKETLEKLARETGVPLPEVVRTDEEDYIAKVEHTMNYPCLVKPVDSPAFMSKFGRKLFKVDNREQLVEAVNKSHAAGFEVIVQRIIPGFDDHVYTYDAYCNQEGKVVQWITCQKMRQFPINYGQSVYTTSRVVPELHEIGAPFLEKIGYRGFAEIEFKKDADTGRFYLIEVNVRITTLNDLLRKLGMNIPYLTWLELTGHPIESYTYRGNSRLTFRYFYEDMLAIRDYIRTKQLSLWQVVKSLFRPKVGAVWSWRDPKPGLAYARMILSQVIRRRLARS